MAREPLRIEFVRQLDENSSEGYRVSCSSKDGESCEFVALKNAKAGSPRKIEYARAMPLADSFFKNAPAAGRAISSGPPTLLWDVTRGEFSSKGAIPWARELSASRPSARQARAVLELEYALMELAH